MRATADCSPLMSVVSNGWYLVALWKGGGFFLARKHIFVG